MSLGAISNSWDSLNQLVIYTSLWLSDQWAFNSWKSWDFQGMFYNSFGIQRAKQNKKTTQSWKSWAYYPITKKQILENFIKSRTVHKLFYENGQRGIHSKITTGTRGIQWTGKVICNLGKPSIRSTFYSSAAKNMLHFMWCFKYSLFFSSRN